MKEVNSGKRGFSMPCYPAGECSRLMGLGLKDFGGFWA